MNLNNKRNKKYNKNNKNKKYYKLNKISYYNKIEIIINFINFYISKFLYLIIN